jgi:signal transduction histidine kinase/ActR/RegA family two-component response regulator
LLGHAKDALDVILGAGCVGFCRIRTSRSKLTANPHFKAYFGWPPDQVLERADLEQRVHAEDRGTLTAAINAAVRQGTPFDLTVRAVWPCGAIQYIALRGRSLAGNEANEGAPRRAIGELVLVANNVTAEREAVQLSQAASAREHELRAVAEAVSRSNAELLSLVSHELRSPLNAMLGWNRLLGIKRGDDAEVQAITARIERGGKAQLRIVNDLLDLEGMGAARFKIEPRAMKLATIGGIALDAAGAAARAKNIDITTDFAATAGDVLGDPGRLGEVVASLISNAIKFTPVGGKIHVSLRRDGNDVELRVSDTGQGIAPELLAQVFDRLRPSDPSSARYAGRLRLGLSLARRIVALHGGTMSASSQGVGRGASFLVRLPARSEPISAGDNDAPVLASSQPRCLAGLGILVVDDDLDARTIIAELLRLEGAKVVVTDSAASAYEKLRAQDLSFDVVVTDIGMPVEDGYSLVRKLRALQLGSHVVAIALTGHATQSDAAAALDAGFDAHVPKPVDFDSLVPMIRDLSQPQARPSAESG